ncbi:MAG: hypothetical protein K1X79_13800 [Oligoflexia bacterium]|nr:hypothetical protein [Oligoflexia bacterium]
MPSMHESGGQIEGLDPDTRRVAEAVYDLSGSGKVVVQKPYGRGVYSAIVTMNGGTYPGEGKLAHDVGRDELITVLDGHFSVTLNDRS